MSTPVDPATLRAVLKKWHQYNTRPYSGAWQAFGVWLEDAADVNALAEAAPQRQVGDYRQCPTCSGWVLRSERHLCDVGPEPAVAPRPTDDLLAEIARLTAERDGLNLALAEAAKGLHEAEKRAASQTQSARDMRRQRDTIAARTWAQAIAVVEQLLNDRLTIKPPGPDDTVAAYRIVLAALNAAQTQEPS